VPNPVEAQGANRRRHLTIKRKSPDGVTAATGTLNISFLCVCVWGWGVAYLNAVPPLPTSEVLEHAPKLPPR
jgi:hypothetical protein